AWRVRTVGEVHALATVADPRRQRRTAHRLAGGDVFGDPLGDLFPARNLPGFERSELPAVTPANREIHVARSFGDGFQVIGGVVEQVAEARPQELRLRVFRFTQLGELLGRVLYAKDRRDFVRRLLFGCAVIPLRKVQHLDFLASLAIETGADLRAQRTFLDQRAQPCGRLEVFVPRVVGQG